jgi:curved DNA-binding protein CbpA
MGNTSAKQNTYQEYYENIHTTNEHIDLNSLDPYKVLNIRKHFTWEELKDAYRQAALKTHPDKKGGNKLIFDFVTSCFRTLAEEYKARSSNKHHQDLKKESNDFFEKIVNNDVIHPSQVFNPNEPFEKRFNKTFDECRYINEDISHGYGEMMAISDGKREEISVQNIFNKDKIDNKTFNQAFNKNVPVSKEIVKYREPEPLIMAKNLKFTEIGAKKPDDYTSSAENRSLAYTDYMKAHNGMRLVNPDIIKSKKEFKSIEDYEKYRDSKTKRGLTEKERKYIEQKKIQEENEEYNRQERIKSQNLAIQKAHEKANRLLLS